MAIKNLPSRFVNSIPSQEQINKDKSGTETFLFCMMKSFNLLRTKEECIQADIDKLNPKNEVLQNELKIIRENLSQIANMIEHELPGVIEDEINDEANLLRHELRELEIKKSALINKIIKLGSYTG